MRSLQPNGSCIIRMKNENKYERYKASAVVQLSILQSFSEEVGLYSLLKFPISGITKNVYFSLFCDFCFFLKILNSSE